MIAAAPLCQWRQLGCWGDGAALPISAGPLSGCQVSEQSPRAENPLQTGPRCGRSRAIRRSASGWEALVLSSRTALASTLPSAGRASGAEPGRAASCFGASGQPNVCGIVSVRLKRNHGGRDAGWASGLVLWLGIACSVTTLTDPPPGTIPSSSEKLGLEKSGPGHGSRA